jgi:hypothetical protein
MNLTVQAYQKLTKSQPSRLLTKDNKTAIGQVKKWHQFTELVEVEETLLVSGIRSKSSTAVYLPKLKLRLQDLALMTEACAED